MYVVVITLTVIVALLMIGVVLIQKSKGGGLSSQFGGANQVMGVRRTNDFIEKTTWYLAGAMAVLCILGVFFMPRNLIQSASRVTPQAVEQTQPADFNTQLPAAPAAETAPAAEAPATPAEAPAAE